MLECNDGSDDVDEIGDSNNGPDGRRSADEPDGANNFERHIHYFSFILVKLIFGQAPLL